MSTATSLRSNAFNPQPVSTSQQTESLLQRKCTCGSPTSALSAKCTECENRKRLQTKLSIGASNDPLEQEADRVADQILSATAHSAARNASPHIQRYTGQAGGAAGTAPESVDRALASSGNPLDPALQHDMGQRFGYDFSQVRVHSGSAAEQSARDVNAHAYTVGHNLVFAAGRYAPGTHEGRRLLAHELTHVVQQTGGQLYRKSTGTKTPLPVEDDEIRTRPRQSRSTGVSRTGIVQRDFAVEPPRPEAEGRVLNATEMADAIAYNERVVAVIGATGIGELRDVLGASPIPEVIDEDFVRAVVDWQAMQRLTQDGKLGPGTARPLFREIGAEDVGRGELVTGPSYRATTSLTPPVVGGNQQAGFRFEAEFADDPANGLYASCCEARQFIRWDAASAAALPGGIPHGGFPAGTGADTWIEDRDGADTRYGHRTGSHSALTDGDEYIDNTGSRNAAFGHLYRGRDFPSGPDALLAGQWRFMVRVIDVCNGNRRLGDDFLRIRW